MPYKAFISYSHEADGEFAEELHEAMEKLAKPWNKRRARRVALDTTAMSAGSSLADTIEEKLADSDWLILLAAKKSAESPWVNDEIRYWKANKSMDNVVVALTDGDIEMDLTDQRVDWDKTTALSDVFRTAVGDDAVPLYEDLRPFKNDLDHANLRNPKFRDEVAKIVGRIEGEDPGELASEDKRQYQHGVRLRRIAVISLIILTIGAVVLGVLAFINAQQASANEERALANEQRALEGEAQARKNEETAIANEQMAIENEQQAVSGAIAAQGIAVSPEVADLGALLALESMRVRPTVDAYISVVNSIVTPTHFRWRAGLDEDPIIGEAASSSDGQLVAMGSEFGEVWLMDPDVPDPLTALNVGAEVIGLAFAEDDSVIRVLDYNGYLTTWDFDTGDTTRVRLEAINPDDPAPAVLSDDGSTIAAVVDAGTIGLFSHTGRSIINHPVEVGLSHNCVDELGCLTISNDGSSVAWVELDPNTFYDNLVVGDVDGNQLLILETERLFTAMAFTPDGETLVVAEDGGLAHLLPASYTSTALLDDIPDLMADAEFFDFAFAESPDGITLPMTTGHLNGSVKLWDLFPGFGFGDQVAEMTRHNDEVHSVAYLPDGSSIVSGSWDGDIISWWSSETAKHGVSNQGVNEEKIVDVTFLGAQRRLASLGEDGTVSVWSAGETGELNHETDFPLFDDEFVTAYSFDATPDGEMLAVGVDTTFLDADLFNTGLFLFDVSGEQLRSIDTPYGIAVSVAFSSDGNSLAAAFSDGVTVAWDTRDLETTIVETPVFKPYFGDVAFSGDGRYLAGSGINGVTVWEVATGQMILTVAGNTSANVTAVALNHDGSVLAWGDDTRLIGLWDINNDQRIGQNLSGHNEEITDLHFVDFGEGGNDVLLASTSRDAEARVWSVTAGRLVARIPAHHNDVTAVDLSADDALMVTSGHDGLLWGGSLDPYSWIDAACSLAGRNMSQAEWEAVQGGEPYIRHCADYPAGEAAPADADAWTYQFTGVVTTAE